MEPKSGQIKNEDELRKGYGITEKRWCEISKAWEKIVKAQKSEKREVVYHENALTALGFIALDGCSQKGWKMRENGGFNLPFGTKPHKPHEVLHAWKQFLGSLYRDEQDWLSQIMNVSVVFELQLIENAALFEKEQRKALKEHFAIRGLKRAKCEADALIAVESRDKSIHLLIVEAKWAAEHTKEQVMTYDAWTDFVMFAEVFSRSGGEQIWREHSPWGGPVESIQIVLIDDKRCKSVGKVFTEIEKDHDVGVFRRLRATKWRGLLNNCPHGEMTERFKSLLSASQSEAEP